MKIVFKVYGASFHCRNIYNKALRFNSMEVTLDSLSQGEVLLNLILLKPGERNFRVENFKKILIVFRKSNQD